MAVFSTNQNRQFYVAKAYGATVTDASNEGTIGAVKCTEGSMGKELHFLYKGANNTLKSDRIQLKNLEYVKAIDAADMVTPLKEIELTLNAAVNSGAPVTGQDYVLRIQFRQFYGLGDQNVYFKDAAVHVTSAIDNAKKFFDAMKVALDKAFSREIGATASANPYLSFTVSGSGSSAKLIIMEKEQDFNLGVGAVERVYFDVVPTTIFNGGDDVVWGTVTDVTASNSTVGTDAMGNGKMVASMEWFYLGERGDQYRMMGYPNYIPTKYLVDSTAQYHILEFHFAFTDTGVNSYRSEKDITIVAPTTAKAALNSFIDAVEAATGLTIAGIS